MNAPRSKSEGSVPLSREMRLDAACVRFEAAWKLGGVPRIDDFLGAATGAERGPLLKELIRLDVSHRRQRGEAVSSATYLQRFPELDPIWLAGEVPSETLVSAAPAQRSGETAPDVAPSRAAPATGAPLQVPGYEILGELGRGGMGVVYLAKNVVMDRREVLKVANKALLDNPGVAERFLREIRSAAMLNHNNVVKAYSALQSGESLLFAMEYVDGEDLDKVVRRQGPLPIPYACHYVSQAAMGLQHAHEQKLIHRDIKPQNLILSRQGKKHVVKILDFGLAKAKREGEAATDLTGVGAMMGTPAYMAPEQAQDAASADIRADIYSLGCTLYFLLTGAPPFTGKSAFAILQAHLSTEPTPLGRLRAEAPAELAAVTAKMMAKDPARRYQKPIEVAQALAPFVKAAASSAKLEKVGPPMAAAVDKAEAPKLREQTPAAPSISRRTTLIDPGAIPTAPMKKPTARKPSRATVKGPNRWSIAGAFAALILLSASGIWLWAGGVFQAKAPPGVPVAEQPPPKPTDTPAEGKEPPRAAAPFDAVEAKRLQQAWADYLGVPVVREVDLGGGVTMKLVLIPPGTFRMGSPDSDKEAVGDEKPQHPVEITRPFYLGVYPIMKGRFATFVKDAGYQTEAEKAGDKQMWRNPGFDQTDNDPVVDVTWNDAGKFCEWLSKKEGKPCELPTEAEWEYACRAGTTTAYSFGDDPKDLGDYAWYNGNSGLGTHPVGGKKPNPWGLYDMHGNVWQWCADRYDEYQEESIKDPKGADSVEVSVLRGGSWDYGGSRGCRSADRHLDEPGLRLDYIGFRIVLRVAVPGIPDKGGDRPPLKPMDKPADGKEPPRATAPFDATEAKRLQQAWAEYLGVPVVREVDLGGGVVMKLVLIPPGTFQMGSPDSDKEAADDEKPRHKVTLSKPFYLGMYPVTQAEYVQTTGKLNPSSFSKDGIDKNDVKDLDTAKFPVESLSWEESAAFCDSLNQKDAKRPAGWKYALPTEAQWEYACRAGTITAYFFGDHYKDLSDYAWHGENSGVRPHEVGTRKPNPWGLYDMGGNVFQWCADYYNTDYYGKSRIEDPQNLYQADTRVLRGGSWNVDLPWRCRSAYRRSYAPGDRYYDVGCRVCLCLD